MYKGSLLQCSTESNGEWHEISFQRWTATVYRKKLIVWWLFAINHPIQSLDADGCETFLLQYMYIFGFTFLVKLLCIGLIKGDTEEVVLPIGYFRWLAMAHCPFIDESWWFAYSKYQKNGDVLWLVVWNIFHFCIYWE